MSSAEVHGSGDALGRTSQSASEADQHRPRTTVLDLQLFSQPPLAARIMSARDRPSATKARKGENADTPAGAQGVATEDAPEMRPEDDRLRILILCNYDPYNAATVCDHINSFFQYSRHEIFILSKIGDLPENFSFDPFDIILIHYSIFISVDAYMSPATRRRLSRFSGSKVMFIQDEYRFVNRTIAAINDCGIDVVFTCVPSGEIAKVYPPDLVPNVGFINVLTGYVPEGLKLFQPRPLAERSITVGYRGRVYPAWHGEAGREKHEIGRRFLADAKRYGIKCDIAWDEDSRIYGIQWVKFIQNCRAMLAVESGASVFDFDGSISATVETFTAVLGLSGKQSARVRQFLRQSGPFSKHPEARELYEALKETFFKEKENLVDLAQLSPRVFEAATLKTLLIMYEGSYSGALKPWRHYVPLRKDHSNMAEVVDILNNPVECAKIISNCYSEVCENEDYSYKKFISKFDRIVEYTCAPHQRSIVPRFTREEMDSFQKFYHIQYPYSLDPAALKRIPNNPLRLIRQIVAPKPDELGLKDIIRSIGRWR
jgi:hypothetical protein